MTSPSYPIETIENNDSVLAPRKRVLLVFLACCIQMIYVPTSNQVSGGIEPRLPIDVFPIWPIWVLPYVLCYVLWLVSFWWIVLKVDDRSFRAFVVACMVTFSIGVGTFVFFPTYIRAVAFPGEGVFSALLRFIHENWGRYDAFPSGHVYITTLVTLFFSRWIPRHRALWIVILIVVSLSTLFTGQHYIIDVLGGYLAGLAGYHAGLWWAGFYSEPKEARKRARKRIASSSWN